jgi:ubiquinone/menaquinone biosynthesis C-methylase UbiE
MNQNKTIQREGKGTAKLFDERSLANDYATLVSALTPGLRVLDVGCGTGAISKDIAAKVGSAGHVTGIDNTEFFIQSGKETYADVKNLELIYTDLFAYQPEEKFDLIVAARVLQWLNNPVEALKKMYALLKPGGVVSILDYNHEALEWQPQPPPSMLRFYATFLRWRGDAGMNNHIAEDLPRYFTEAGFTAIAQFNADEVYRKGESNFVRKAGIWASVAQSKQMVDEGYIDDELRLLAIDEYTEWVATDAERMTMKLKEIRGTKPHHI